MTLRVSPQQTAASVKSNTGLSTGPVLSLLAAQALNDSSAFSEQHVAVCSSFIALLSSSPPHTLNPILQMKKLSSGEERVETKPRS